jgi:hypothetical protein
MTDSGAHNLIAAIVNQAVNDYKNILRASKRHPEDPTIEGRKHEIERFFTGSYFYELTGREGETVIRRLQSEEHYV